MRTRTATRPVLQHEGLITVHRMNGMPQWHAGCSCTWTGGFSVTEELAVAAVRVHVAASRRGAPATS